MAPRVHYHGIHHVSLLVADTAKSLAFYVEVLSMSLDPSRPLMSYRGAWLNVTPGPGSQQIHLIELPNPDPVEGRPAHGGHDRHCAFTLEDITPLQQSLDQAGVPYTLSRSGRRALFCRDPDGNALEFSERRGAVSPDGASSPGS